MREADRFELAMKYQKQRERVIGIYEDHGHGPRHSNALKKLSDISQALHAAETAAGVPIGTTREEMGLT